jgi:phosphoribosylglycinamide formyltransferase
MTKANIPMINLHPALPGQFSGANAIGRAWEAFQRGEITGTGAMIHEVIGEVDMGETVVMKDVPIRGCNSESELAERIHQVEWKLIVEGTAKVVKDLERKRKSEAR